MKNLVFLFALLFLSSFARAEEIAVDKGKIIGYLPSVPAKDKANGMLCIAMPGGPMTKDIAIGMKGWPEGMAKRGYYSVMLYTNFGPLLDIGPMKTHHYLEKAIDAIRGTYKITTEKILLIGGSNGGKAALQYAVSHPTKIQGVIAAPGQFMGGNLRDIPILFQIGEKDEQGWAAHYQLMAQSLKQSGAVLTTELLNGKGHMFDLNWAKVDTWLKTLK